MMGKVPRDLDVLQLTILLHALQQYVDRQCILDSNALYTLQLLQLHSTSLSMPDHERLSVFGKQTESFSKLTLQSVSHQGTVNTKALQCWSANVTRQALTTDPINRLCLLQIA